MCALILKPDRVLEGWNLKMRVSFKPKVHGLVHDYSAISKLFIIFAKGVVYM